MAMAPGTSPQTPPGVLIYGDVAVGLSERVERVDHSDVVSAKSTR